MCMEKDSNNNNKQPENIQWLRIVLMNRGFELMIGTVDKHAIRF